MEGKGRLNFLIILNIFLLLGVGVLVWQFIERSRDLEDTTEEKEFIEETKKKLEIELEQLYADYDTIQTENDSIKAQLDKKQAYIKNLLAMNASNIEKIKIFEKELKTLREVMRSYIVQIDSLNRRNQVLTSELHDTKNQLRVTEKEKEDLESEKEELSEKVSTASVLKASGVTANPYNKRSNLKDKAKKVEKIETFFTIRENQIVEPGTRTIFLRIVNPQGIVLANDQGATFPVDGKQVAFSAKRDVQYENKDLDVSIWYFVPENTLTEGTYKFTLYEGGRQIGATTMTLK